MRVACNRYYTNACKVFWSYGIIFINMCSLFYIFPSFLTVTLLVCVIIFMETWCESVKACILLSYYTHIKCSFRLWRWFQIRVLGHDFTELITNVDNSRCLFWKITQVYQLFKPVTSHNEHELKLFTSTCIINIHGNETKDFSRH
jgi:hypothetical protein